MFSGNIGVKVVASYGDHDGVYYGGGGGSAIAQLNQQTRLLSEYAVGTLKIYVR